MSKYSYEQMLKIMKILIDCDDGEIPTKTAAIQVLEAAPTYPIHNLNKELSKVKKYRSGRGAYGYSYPAGWSKAFIEVTSKDPNVINALKEQQKLYQEKDGSFNNKLQDVLNNL